MFERRDEARTVSPGGDAPGLSAPLRQVFGFAANDDASWFANLRVRVRPPTLGRVGSFDLIAEAGRGGQGLVYRAHQDRPAREVALKRLTAGVFATPAMRMRFEREIESAAALDHPNIVKVYGVEEADGQLIVAMQWIDGESLDRWARPMHGKPRAVSEVLTAFLKICDAVHHAHQRGVIHRDLKPSNVLIDAQGEPHVLDFGLARRSDDASSDPQLTRSGVMLGTPAYAPPEQLRGDVSTVAVCSDVYSLGAMLYRALTGVTPVDPALPPLEMLHRIERFDPRSPRLLNPALDREISLIVLKALRPEPEQRYASAEALAADLRRYQSGRPIHAHPPSLGYRLRKLTARNTAALSVAGVVAVLLVVAGAIASVQQQRVKDALARESDARAKSQQADAAAALEDLVDRAIKLQTDGAVAEAEALYRDVLARRGELVGEEHWSVIAPAENLGLLLYRSHRFEEARQFFAMAFAACMRVHGPAHATTLNTGLGLARMQVCVADYSGAEATCLTVNANPETENGKGFDSSLFRSYLLRGRFTDALVPLERGLVYTRGRYGEAHRYTAGDVFWMGEVMRLNGDVTAARARFETAIAILEPLVEQRRKKADNTESFQLHLGLMGYALMRLDRLDEAERALREVNAARYSESTTGRSRKGFAMTYLGECLVKMGRAEEGEQLLVQGQWQIEDPSYIPIRFAAVLALIELYGHTGRSAELAHWRDCVATRPFREWGPPGAPAKIESRIGSAKLTGASDGPPVAPEASIPHRERE